MTQLATTLEQVRSRIVRLGSRTINEENTKATLIEPVLRALGWAVEDVDEVQREFKTHRRHKPVDYGLLVLRTPRLLLEAKALGSNLSDHRWVNQIMGYASVAGVEWIVLTDGDEYRIYNTHAPVVVEQKLFRSVRITGGDPLVAQTLELLAKNRLEENRIEVLWRAQYVDRQVKAAIEDLLSPEGNDTVLVNHVERATKNLSTEEIRSSIARCRFTLDFPTDLDELIGANAKAKSKKKRASKPRQEKVEAAASSSTLAELVAAGAIKTPVQLTKVYKGTELAATLLATGKIRVGKAEFDSPSSAAIAAIKSVTGVTRSVNGWDFWQVEQQGGVRVALGSFRDASGPRDRATG